MIDISAIKSIRVQLQGIKNKYNDFYKSIYEALSAVNMRKDDAGDKLDVLNKFLNDTELSKISMEYNESKSVLEQVNKIFQTDVNGNYKKTIVEKLKYLMEMIKDLLSDIDYAIRALSLCEVKIKNLISE